MQADSWAENPQTLGLAVKQLSSGLLLGEGPRFDDDGALYFGDAVGIGLFRLTPTGVVELVDPERRAVCGVVMDVDGSVICSGRDGLMRYDPRTNDRRAVPITIDGVEIHEINDIEADAHGNLYGGTIDFAAFERGTPPAPGIVFRLGVDGTATRLLRAAVPNGMEFSADDQTFFLSETTEGVFAYDIGRDGTLGGRRLFAAMPDSDGIALDVAGGLWVARYQTNRIEYYDRDGALRYGVATPFAAAASVTFGGPDLRDLYVVGGDMKDAANGGVARLKVDIPGRPSRKSSLGAIRP